MTLPASGTISLTLVMNELRIATPSRAYPISLGDSDVRALAGKPSGPISLSDLYGKSATPPAQPLMLYPSASDNSFSSSSDGTASILISVAAIGGARPLTFTWSNISRTNGMTLQGEAVGPALSFSREFLKNSTGTATASAQCTVTDANGATSTTNLLTGRATWGNA